MKNTILILSVLVSLFLSACQHNRMTSSQTDENYCKDHPAECVAWAQNDGEVK